MSRSIYISFILLILISTVVSETELDIDYNIARQRCPDQCGNQRPELWSSYPNIERLRLCDQPLLLSFALRSDLSDGNTPSPVQACTLSSEQSLPQRDINQESFENNHAGDWQGCTSEPVVKVLRKLEGTPDESRTKRDSVAGEPVQYGSKNMPDSPVINNTLALDLIRHVEFYLERQSDCKQTTLLAYHQGMYVGTNFGRLVNNGETRSALLNGIARELTEEMPSSNMMIQACERGQDADVIAGISIVFFDTSIGLASVQKDIQRWSRAECHDFSGYQTKYLDIPTYQAPSFFPSRSYSKAVISSVKPFWNATSYVASNTFFSAAEAQAECRYITVVEGDGCPSLARKCGISGHDIEVFNLTPLFCKKLKSCQKVCCSPGRLPDSSPKPDADGTCATHTTERGESCACLEARFGLTRNDLGNFNKKTWGWNGCDPNRFLPGIKMCISSGRPPMPEPDKTHVCGPRVPGTRQLKFSSLEALNPCPLNACCNTWGQCGLTDEFCTKSKVRNGAPGTYGPSEKGACISNCETGIVNNKKRPAQFSKIGYFESWNLERPCMRMDISDVKTEEYTHIHFAFAGIRWSDFTVNVTAVQDQFDKFVHLRGVKRILSFGGWSFSTDMDTQPIFRNGVSSGNRLLFANNVVQFLKRHDLDGLDFDWEYPGAPAGPGMPAGGKEDGKNYLEFLKQVKGLLPPGKTLSIAAPASYWYLKGFPIQQMEPYLDYIIYMTYDLHGQWDYDNRWSQPGCLRGNCLRSHVNYTETLEGLSMITKAGMPSYKVMVGISSYGRSFRMTKPGCTGPMCTFTGKASGATKGVCTDTAGYISNAEIKVLWKSGLHNAKYTFDKDSLSNIFVYDDVQWVSWMDDTQKAVRVNLYEQMNFGGTSDWAIDLQTDVTSGDGTTSSIADCYETSYPYYATLDKLQEANVPEECRGIYVTQILAKLLKTKIDTFYTLMQEQYDTYFDLYVDAVKGGAPGQLQSFMDQVQSIQFTCIASIWDDKIPGYRNETQDTCPGISAQASEPSLRWSVYYILRDEKAFFDALERYSGIQKEWVKFKTISFMPGDNCDPSSPKCDDHGFYHDYPTVDDFKIANPRDYIQDMLPKLRRLQETLEETSTLAMMGMYDGDIDDVAESSGIAVFLVESAIKSMEEIGHTGRKLEKEKKKNLIVMFASLLLFLLPFIGEAAGASLGVAGLARMASVIANGGGIAMSVEEIVASPNHNDPMAIFGLIFGFGGLASDARAFSKAAQIRRGMKAGDIAKFGKDVQQGTTKVSAILKACRRR